VFVFTGWRVGGLSFFYLFVHNIHVSSLAFHLLYLVFLSCFYCFLFNEFLLRALFKERLF
jgi:hypothetical protein